MNKQNLNHFIGTIDFQKNNCSQTSEVLETSEVFCEIIFLKNYTKKINVPVTKISHVGRVRFFGTAKKRNPTTPRQLFIAQSHLENKYPTHPNYPQ